MPSLLPPGPRSALVQTARYALDPYGFYAALARRYGDLFTVPTLLGPLVVCGHPEGARDLYAAAPDHFARWATDAVEPLLGPNALTLTSGPQHQRDRRLLAPPFHAARMRAYGAVIQAATRREAARWPRGGVVRLLDAAQAIALDVILRAVFGVDDPAEVAAFRAEVLRSIAALHPVIMLVRAARRPFGGVGPWARFARARERIDALTYGEIARRRARPPADPSPATSLGARGEDILDLMLAARYDDGGAMTDREVRDQLLTLVFAGHETTGIALAWAVYWLDGHPPARARLLDEVRALGRDPAPDALAALPWLGAVCDETLRLHPVIPEVIRLLVRPLVVMGTRLPAGVAVAACTTLLHAREEIYPDAASFRPERFLARRYAPHEYTPFGGGSRRCIGAAFALHTMKVVLGTLYAGWDVRRADAGVVRPALRNLTVGPAGGIPIVATAR